MPKTLTKQGALQITAKFDELASLVQTFHNELKINEKIAKDFAMKCDMISDHVEKVAGVDRTAKDFDPATIGETKPGPLVDGEVEKDCAGEFTQQENSELQTKQKSGKLASLTRKAEANELASLAGNLKEASSKLSFFDSALGRSVLKLASLAEKVADKMKDSDWDTDKDEPASDAKEASVEIWNQVEPLAKTASETIANDGDDSFLKEASKLSEFVSMATKILENSVKRVCK